MQPRDPGRPLVKLPNGRFAIGDDELTSGEPIEYEAHRIRNGTMWLKGRIEHDGHDYFFAWLNAENPELYHPLPLIEGRYARRLVPPY